MEENNAGKAVRIEFDENGQVDIVYPIEPQISEFTMPQKGSDMPYTQIFVGQTDSGKSRLAREIAKGKNTVWLDGRNFHSKKHFAFGAVSRETELLIIDDVPVKKLYDLLCRLLSREIVVERLGCEIFKMTRPRTIITCECDDFPLEPHGATFTRRFEVVKLPKQGPEIWQAARKYANKILMQRPTNDSGIDPHARYLIEEAYEAGAAWAAKKQFSVSVSPVKMIPIEFPVNIPA